MNSVYLTYLTVIALPGQIKFDHGYLYPGTVYAICFMFLKTGSSAVLYNRIPISNRSLVHTNHLCSCGMAKLLT